MFTIAPKISLTTREKNKAKVAQRGFTIIESIVAASILIIICVGVLTVFDQVIRLNRINNVRSQALSILQKEVEYYRSLKYSPGGTDIALNGRTAEVTKTNVASADGTRFDITVTIDNDPYTTGVQIGDDANCKFKEIKIEATLTTPQSGVSALNTVVNIQRVRLIG